MKLSHLFILSLCLIALSSCGKNAQALQEEAILKAQNFLSVKSCSEAISVLEAVKYDHLDARFLKTLSSAYACKANYSTITFFASDIEKTSLPAPIGGMTTYSTSLSTTSQSIEDDHSFINLVKAVDILLYAGGISPDVNPTSALRAEHFSPKILADLHNQLAFMMMVELGKYMKIYGNTNASGEKGTGPIASTCFTNYSNGALPIKLYLNSGVTGSCTFDTGISHPDLDLGVVRRKEKMCRGVTIMNNLISLLPEVISASGGGQVDALVNFIEDISEIKDMFITNFPMVEETLEVTSYNKCVDDAAITEETLEAAFVAYFETMVQ